MKPALLFVCRFVLHPTSPGQTGGTISNYQMLKALSRRYRVKILALQGSEHDAASLRSEGFEVVRDCAPHWRGLALAANWRAFVRQATRRALGAMNQPAWLIATTDTLAALDRDVGAGPRTCAIVRAYENFGFRPPAVSLSTRIALAKRWLVHGRGDVRSLREADLVLTNSRFMARAVSSRFGLLPSRIRTVYPCCDISADPAPAPPATVGFVNRGADKNLGFVLRLGALAPDITFLVYGRGSRARGIPSNVEMRNWSGDRVEMFRSARVWIMPSLWAEPFGRVSIEAQACNRAVLASRIGGLPETVDNPLFMIDGYDAEAWVERLRTLLTLPATELRRNAHVIAERYSRAAHDRTLLGALDGGMP